LYGISIGPRLSTCLPPPGFFPSLLHNFSTRMQELRFPPLLVQRQGPLASLLPQSLLLSQGTAASQVGAQQLSCLSLKPCYLLRLFCHFMANPVPQALSG